MIDFKMDPVSRDMVFGPGAAVVPLDGAERVAQAVGIRLRAWLGEWFLDQARGVPYVDSVFGKGGRPEMIEATLRAQILGVAGVRSIETFEMQIDAQTRKLRVDFSVVSEEGLASGSTALG
jgi:hypothetical protein